MRRLILIVILLVCAHEVRATVLLPAEFREIVAGSQVIVYGRIAAVRAEWSDDRTRIDTGPLPSNVGPDDPGARQHVDDRRLAGPSGPAALHEPLVNPGASR